MEQVLGHGEPQLVRHSRRGIVNRELRNRTNMLQQQNEKGINAAKMGISAKKE